MLASYTSPAVFAVTRWAKTGTLDTTYGSGGACIISPQPVGGDTAYEVRMVAAGDGSARVVFSVPNNRSALASCSAKGTYDSAAPKLLGAGYLADAARTPERRREASSCSRG